jgi:hypothetical protein
MCEYMGCIVLHQANFGMNCGMNFGMNCGMSAGFLSGLLHLVHRTSPCSFRAAVRDTYAVIPFVWVLGRVGRVAKGRVETVYCQAHV